MVPTRGSRPTGPGRPAVRPFDFFLQSLEGAPNEVGRSVVKVPALKAMAPTQSEPPFAITQVVVLVFFTVLSIIATKRFRDESSLAAQVIASNVSSNQICRESCYCMRECSS